jgi:putative oxidoreductase
MAEKPMGRFAVVALTALRVASSLMLMAHGAQKLFGCLGGMGGAGQTATFPELIWFAGVIEFFGGGLVLIGLWSRPVAFLISGELATAYFMMHAPHAFWPVHNHGEPAALFSFVFLAISALGPGPLSLDHAFRR